MAIQRNMKVLVCGGRNASTRKDYGWFCEHMYSVASCKFPIEEFIPPQKYAVELISGGARGIDTFARRWAFDDAGVDFHEFPADWEKYGKSASPIRNIKMLDEGKPDLVIAFPGGSGTAHCVREAKKRGIEVIEIDPKDCPYRR